MYYNIKMNLKFCNCTITVLFPSISRLHKDWIEVHCANTLRFKIESPQPKKPENESI